MARRLPFRLALVAAALGPLLAAGPARGQVLDEILSGRINDVATNPFNCAAPAIAEVSPCNLHQRLYGDLDPSRINASADPLTAANDGYPSYRSKPMRYTGDELTTAAYAGISSLDDRCEAWYSVWDAVLDPDTGNYITYYGAQAQIVSFTETGNSNFADCGDVSQLLFQACFAALDAALAVGVSTATPLGDLGGFGGLEPVPVPRISACGSLAQAGELELLTPEPIPATGMASGGAGYEFIDEERLRPGTYYYYIQDLNGAGRLSLHGPLQVRLPVDIQLPDRGHAPETPPGPPLTPGLPSLDGATAQPSSLERPD